MAAELALLAIATLVFLAATFVIASTAERRPSFARLAAQPLVFGLALGAYATSWTFYGVVGSARDGGLAPLAIYLGPTIACLAIPAIGIPLLRVLRERRLSTVADLFAFRYASQSVGVIVTLATFASQLLYVSVQIRAVAHASAALAPGAPLLPIGAVFCAVLGGFAALFAARHAAGHEHHPGLVLALAFGSLVKVAALAAVGALALFGVLGGPSELARWLEAHPDAEAALLAPMREGSFATQVSLAAVAVFLLPRQFHLLFTEAPPGEAGERAVRHASWTLPLVLLLLELPIPVLLWAGERIAAQQDADFWVLAIAARHPITSILAFVGGVAASSGMVVVSSVAMANMALTHLVLPLARPRDPYRTLVIGRRALIIGVVALGWMAFALLERAMPAQRGGALAEIGLVSFVGAAQLAPGMVGVLAWRGATRRGVSAGLVAGMALWGATMIAPLLERAGLIPAGPDLAATLGLAPLADPLGFAAALSVGANTLVMVAISLASRPTQAEERAASICAREVGVESALALPSDARAFEAWLAPALGEEAAGREVDRARADLGIDPDETRAEPLLRLRDRLLVALTGLVGPVIARRTFDRGTGAPPSRLLLLEHKLEAAPAPRDARAAAESELRRYLRAVLEELPLGICVLGPEGEIVLWNGALARTSGLPAERAIGSSPSELPPHVASAIDARGEITVEGRVWNVGRSALEAGGAVIVIEDRTGERALQARLAHQDRLASIGRLAAGIAHEIGNPLAGILMVARNLRAEEEPSDVPERVGAIAEQAARIDAIVRGLLTFSRAAPGPSQGRAVAVSSVVRDAVRLAAMRKKGRIEIVEPIADAIEVRGDPTQLQQVLVNLLDNALDASPRDESVRIEVAEDETSVSVSVIDRGPGMTEEVRARIFDPFFTTKDPGEGTGLGLSIVHTLVAAHGGTIEVQTGGVETGAGGSTFRVRLPRARDAAE